MLLHAPVLGRQRQWAWRWATSPGVHTLPSKPKQPVCSTAGGALAAGGCPALPAWLALPTLVDGVVGHVDVHARRGRRATDVLQLLHRLLAHVLQLGDVVVHIGDLQLRGVGVGGSGGFIIL